MLQFGYRGVVPAIPRSTYHRLILGRWLAPIECFQSADFAIGWQAGTALPQAIANLMNTLKANQSLARNALSVEFSKLARKWLSIVASKRFEDQETILATDCSYALRKLKRHGFLAEISNLLAEEPRIDPPGVFSFDPPGRDFYRFAGYCEIELVELSEEYSDWVLRPGLFNNLVQTLGMITPWDFQDLQRLTLDNPEAMDAVFDMYHQICETLSKAILDEGTKAASTDLDEEGKPTSDDHHSGKEPDYNFETADDLATTTTSKGGKKRGPKSGQSVPNACEKRIFELRSKLRMDFPEILEVIQREFKEEARVRNKVANGNCPKITTAHHVDLVCRAMQQQAKRDSQTR